MRTLADLIPFTVEMERRGITVPMDDPMFCDHFVTENGVRIQKDCDC